MGVNSQTGKGHCFLTCGFPRLHFGLLVQAMENIGRPDALVLPGDSVQPSRDLDLDYIGWT